LLAATCTDDYGGTIYPLRVFINGTEIKSSGIETVTGQGNETRYFDLTPFEKLLQIGTNLIAVQLNNAFNSSWDDVAFDVSLKAVIQSFSNFTLDALGRDAAGAHLKIETPVGTLWQLESRDGFSDTWHLVQTVPGGTQQILDSGQNGRSHPSS